MTEIWKARRSRQRTSAMRPSTQRTPGSKRATTRPPFLTEQVCRIIRSTSPDGAPGSLSTGSGSTSMDGSRPKAPSGCSPFGFGPLAGGLRRRASNSSTSKRRHPHGARRGCSSPRATSRETCWRETPRRAAASRSGTGSAMHVFSHHARTLASPYPAPGHTPIRRVEPPRFPGLGRLLLGPLGVFGAAGGGATPGALPWSVRREGDRVRGEGGYQRRGVSAHSLPLRLRAARACGCAAGPALPARRRQRPVRSRCPMASAAPGSSSSSLQGSRPARPARAHP